MSTADDSERTRLAEIARLTAAPSTADADIAFLIDCLGQPRKATTRAAAEALAAAAGRGASVTAALLTTLGDSLAARRWGAAYTLARLGPPSMALLPTLLEVMGSLDGDLRWAAADIVKRIGTDVSEELVALASSGNPAQRKMALYCLRDLHPPTNQLEPVLLAALDDPDVGVRLAGLAALTRSTSDRTAAAIQVVRLTADADAGVRRAAVSALGTLGQRTPEIERIVRDAANTRNDPGLRRAAERTMAMLGMASGPGPTPASQE